MAEEKKTLKERLKEYVEPMLEIVREVKGHKDVKTRLQVLTDPDNLDVMSNLSKNEAEFLAVTNWLAKQSTWGVMFTGLNQFAQARREPNISIDGGGREDAIRLMGAISESKFLSKLGLSVEKGGKD